MLFFLFFFKNIIFIFLLNHIPDPDKATGLSVRYLNLPNPNPKPHPKPNRKPKPNPKPHPKPNP